ncbi:MAG: HAD-IIA family hydrolase [Anaerolineae bacterium]|nr:HAD-IIA family hydrolase [Anaerolineae bacterium]
MNFSDIKAVVSDMDGVLWRGDEPLPGMVTLFQMLRARNMPFVLATNNSMKAPSDYVAKLAKMGVPDVRAEQIVTSSTTTVSYMKANYPAGSPVHVLGGDGLRRLLIEGGFKLDDTAPKAVVVGLDTNLTYDKLKRASFLIQAGANFIATNQDDSIPTPEGLAPGAGSIVAALKAASGKQPLVMGKPDAPMFEAALRLVGTAASQTLMIGDRLNTDITGAALLGFKTALVLTGVSTRADAEVNDIKPDAIYADLATLLQAWE